MSEVYVWSVILGLGLATWAIRFSFLGLLRGRTLPPGLERALRYTPVAVLPAMAAPMAALDRVGGGLAPAHAILAALLALAVGALWRSLIGTIVVGMAAWHGLRALGL